MPSNRKSFKAFYRVLIGIGLSLFAVAGLQKLGVVHWLPSPWLNVVHADKPAPSSSQSNAKTIAEDTKLNVKAQAVEAAVTELGKASSFVTLTENEIIGLKALNQLQIQPGGMFSYNQWSDETKKANGFSASDVEHSHIAGLLYEAAVRAGLAIGERSTHWKLPVMAAAGFDTAIVAGKKDLTFANLQAFAVMVAVDVEEGHGVVRVWGAPPAEWKAPVIKISQEKFVPEQLVLIDYSLKAAAKDIVREKGAEGVLIKVTCDCSQRGESKLFSKDYYAPEPIILARAPIAESPLGNNSKAAVSNTTDAVDNNAAKDDVPTIK